MPLVRIEVRQGRSAAELTALGDGVHRALVEAFGIPEQDRFQVISEHPAEQLVFDPQYLGIARTGAFVMIQITINAGRNLEKKRALYAAITRNLAASPGVRPEDVMVNLLEVVKENWSFGNGVAQYAD